MNCCKRLLSPLAARILLPSDSEQERQRKLSCSFLAVGTLLSYPHYQDALFTPTSMARVEHGLSLAVTLGSLSYMFATRRMPEPAFLFILFVYFIFFAVLDLSQQSQNAVPATALLVVLMDVLLLGARRSAQFFFLGLCLLWFAVSVLEAAYRFGLWDMPGLASYERRREKWAERGECPEPPCAVGLGTALVFNLPMLVVFLLDFFVTRGFAVRLEAERDGMAQAVDAAQSIASCLASFDLTAAEGRLAQSDLPHELHAAFSTLLENLHKYRPFLPAALFAATSVHGSEDSAPQEDPSVPGVLPPHRAAIVFTDIRRSTDMWNHAPEAMHAALQTHNNVIRCAIVAHDGYEVKTIGDAFMVAFQTAAVAVQFACDVQEAFANTALWPEGLSRGARDEYAVFTVRIGIHTGDVFAERSPLTQRYDYFGSTVNMASRVEAQAVPGAVTVTRAVLDEAKAPLLSAYTLVPHGGRHVRGFGEAVELTTILPPALSSRVDFVKHVCRESANEARGYDTSPRALSPIIGTRGGPCPVTASVAVLRLGSCEGDESEARASKRLAVVHKHSFDTSGVLSSVAGPFAIVSWGVHRRCVQHTNHSVRFLLLLQESEPELGSSFRAGLATGPAQRATVKAAPSLSFITILGPCVDLGVMLCHAAAELETCTLAAAHGEGGHKADPFLSTYMRPVDVWTGTAPVVQPHAFDKSLVDCLDFSDSFTRPADTAAEATLCVYELRLPELRHAVGLSVASVGDDFAALSYTRAYVSRDVETLRNLARDDTVVAKVCELLETGRHLQHSFL